MYDKKKTFYNTVIIGGGASGMMAAISSAASSDVLLIEADEILGRKLYATGNGKCNFTNENQSLDNYFSSDSEFLSGLIGRFSYDDTISFFRSIGVEPFSRNGYIYPASEQARSIVNALKSKLSLMDNVKIKLNTDVNGLKKSSGGFAVSTADGEIECTSLIISTGLNAGINIHEDIFGLKAAESFGISYARPLPALIRLRTDKEYFSNLAGVRTNARATLYCDGQHVMSDEGQIQFNEDSVSGIPILQLSGEAIKHLDKNEKTAVSLDFNLGNVDLVKRQERLGGLKAKQFFNGFLNDKLGQYLLHQVRIPQGIPVEAIDPVKMKELSRILSDFRINIIPQYDVSDAQTSSGGVLLSELNESLECIRCPGLFFTGELIDIYGKCGGYNLQLAWTSGYVAGTGAARRAVLTCSCPQTL